jgi:hypothetical protein
MLKNNFPENVKLQIKVKGKYYTTTPTVFRSWHGDRRADGKAFKGDVYYFGTNDIYRSLAPKAESGTIKLKPEKILKALPLYLRVIKQSSKGPGTLPITKTGRPVKVKK